MSRQHGERLRLLCLQGVDEGACYCLLADTVVIGREDADLVLPDRNVSTKHAELIWNGTKSQYAIRDLKSSNGIILNGKKVEYEFLFVGDVLVLGASVFQVCGAGQTNKNAPLGRANQMKELKNQNAETKSEEKKLTEKRKLIFFAVIIFALYLAYRGSDNTKTRRESKLIDLGDEAESPAKNSVGKKSKKEKEIEKKRLETVFDEYIPKYTGTTQQFKDADKYFHQGIREYQNKNYRRAISFFETALTVDPSHQLAKVYLTSTKTKMYDEIKQDLKAAKEAKAALRYQQARNYYSAILRLMEISKDDDTYKNDDFFKAATDGLAELDKLEGITP